MVGILDTNALIYISNKRIDSSVILERYSSIYISSISHIEFLGFNFTDAEDLELAKSIVKQFEIIHTNDFISQIAIQYRQKRKIKLPDAIILATASHLGAELCTANVDDFKSLDERVVLFNPIITKA
jgi:predicted nucleic acid-binding protein